MDFDIADGWVWGLVIVGGPLLLGIFMWIFSGRRKMNAMQKKAADAAAHENWGKERIH